ncbi:endonuclease Q family protein [Chitinispirillales bacterium ANBcel5]|uniref:endonuclease Q family protein n=1 Tax=Cellulosispirillum alkaliphilum TaxID=3039283 RepID=UPI002A4F9B18|nr:endonuclease Q family protein [Chitinispirillales bacterium ANBcel5]
MRFIADLHIHSHFSIATSKQLTPEMLDLWSKKKGITVTGTGDAVHPGWRKELKEKLRYAGNGLYTLKKAYRLPESNAWNTRHFFMLTAEISCIYKFDGRVRKVHNIIAASDFKSMDKIARRLERVGNIASDGRPILGLDSRDLLEIVLESGDNNFLIPAHIWTPWFSVLGSRSGFDSVEQCFRDLSSHIFALETGLSSDPPMNRGCSFLDRYALISSSDAHSPEKLGREATLFNTDISFGAMVAALKNRAGGELLGTIEFFPEEGKYHLDGHRKCGIRWQPQDTLEHNGLCPVCGKAVTVGVLSRVTELADRRLWGNCKNDNFYYLTSLKGLLSEITGTSAGSKKTAALYESCLSRFGSEFDILLTTPLTAIKGIDSRIAEGIRRLRAGTVTRVGGFDGEFGSIKLFT